MGQNWGIPPNETPSIAWMNFGLAQFGQKNYDGAIDSFNKAIQIDPNLPKVWNHLGDCYRLKGVMDYAISAYLKAIEQAPKFALAHYNLGLAFIQKKEFKFAIESVQTALNIEPKYPPAWVTLGDLFVQQDNLDQAEYAFRKAVDYNPILTTGWLGLGNSLLKKENYVLAIDAFIKAITLEPKNHIGHFYHGLTLYYLKEYDRAIVVFRKAIELNANYPASWFNLGLCFTAKLEYENALITYRKAISINQNYVAAWNGAGNALKAKGQLDEAIIAYQKVVSLDKNHKFGWNSLGIAYITKKNYAAAISVYQRVLELDQKYIPAWYGIGNAYYEIRDYENALKSYKRVIEIDINYYHVWLSYACCLIAMNEEDQAVEFYRNLVQNYPQIVKLIENDQSLNARWNRYATHCQKTERFRQLTVEILTIEQTKGSISKADIVREFHIDLEESSELVDLINQDIEFDQKEIPILKTYALEMIKIHYNPSLLDILTKYQISVKTAKKVGKYLESKGFIPKFERIPKKEEELQANHEKDSIKVSNIDKDIQITRGFEVAGDTFKFFIRVQNNYPTAISDVIINLILPKTLKLDPKSNSLAQDVGLLAPGKFGTVIFYLYCVGCSDATINASVGFFDPAAEWKTVAMPPFQITSCKYVHPRSMTIQEYSKARDDGLNAGQNKKLEIMIQEGVSENEIKRVLKERLTLSEIQSTGDGLDMAGTAKDGSTVLFRALVNKIEGMEKLVAEIISPNQQVQMGLLSEVIEGMKEIRRDTTDIKQDTAEIKEDMQKVLNDLELILENQAIEFAQLEDFRNELDDQINTLNLKMNELEAAGQFDQISQIQNTLEGLRREVEEQNQKIDLRLDSIGLNLGKAIDFIRPNEENVEEKVGSSVWARIKKQWQDFKDELKSDNKDLAKEKLKELIKSTGKEFGKKSLKMLVSWMTGGVIQLPL